MLNEKIKKYDLEERSAMFSQRIIKFCKNLPADLIASVIISQLIRSATSIGANYCEADNADSRKDFKYKIGICKREAKETRYWLRLIMCAVPDFNSEAEVLRMEANELCLIFNKIYNSTVKNDNTKKII